MGEDAQESQGAWKKQASQEKMLGRSQMHGRRCTEAQSIGENAQDAQEKHGRKCSAVCYFRAISRSQCETVTALTV